MHIIHNKMKSRLNICATIEARMSSKRLPGKVLLPIQKVSMLKFIISRLKLSKKVQKIIVATTNRNEDKVIQNFCKEWKVHCYAGSSDNIISRLLNATHVFKSDLIVQTTGDNPFVDPKLIDYGIEIYLRNDYDYVCNHLKKTFPLGLEVKIFSRATLAKADKLVKNKFDKQHGSSFIYNNPKLFKVFNFVCKEKRVHDLRLTVDEPEDYETVNQIVSKINKKNFCYKEIIKIAKKYPEVLKNKKIKQKKIADG